MIGKAMRGGGSRLLKSRKVLDEKKKETRTYGPGLREGNVFRSNREVTFIRKAGTMIRTIIHRLFEKKPSRQ